MEEIPLQNGYYIGEHIICKRRILGFVRKIYKIKFNNGASDIYIYNCSCPLSNIWYMGQLFFTEELEKMTERKQIALRLFYPNMKNSSIYSIGMIDDNGSFYKILDKVKSRYHNISENDLEIYETSESIFFKENNVKQLLQTEFIRMQLNTKNNLNDRLINCNKYFPIIPSNRNNINVSTSELKDFLLNLKECAFFLYKKIINIVRPTPKYYYTDICYLKHFNKYCIVRDILLIELVNSLCPLIYYNVEILYTDNDSKRGPYYNKRHIQVPETFLHSVDEYNYCDLFNEYYINYSFHRHPEIVRNIKKNERAQNMYILTGKKTIGYTKYFEDTSLENTNRNPKTTTQPFNYFLKKQYDNCIWKQIY